MSSESTITLFAETFISLSSEMPIEKISISDIVNRSKKNRKTFYYHFTDKNALIHWIFRNDLSTLLRAKFPEEQLVYLKEQDDEFANMPHYLMIKNGVRSLDGQPFFETMAECLEARRGFYSKALKMTDMGNLRSYLYELYVPAIKNDARFILSNRYLKEESLDYLAEFFAGAFVDVIVRRTCAPKCLPILHGMEPFGNLLHSSLESAIKEQQMRRTL